MRTETPDALFARAAGRRVFGYDSRTGRGGEVKERLWPGTFDRGCVEGDSEWSRVEPGDARRTAVRGDAGADDDAE
jgi:hypothetical protein